LALISELLGFSVFSVMEAVFGLLSALVALSWFCCLPVGLLSALVALSRFCCLPVGLILVFPTTALGPELLEVDPA
jgi:hypothetical protein